MYGDDVITKRTVQKGFKHFKNDNFKDFARSGRPVKFNEERLEHYSRESFYF